MEKGGLVSYLLLLFLMTALLHVITVCKDPGYLKKPTGVTFMQMLEQFDPVLLCPDCEVVRTDRSRHCSICGKCVERFDHHCPWINNCVGTGNHGFFALFILSMYTLLISTTVILLLNLDCHQNKFSAQTYP